MAEAVLMNGAEYYAGLYRNDLSWEVEWLLAGAVHKSWAVEYLLQDAGVHVNRVCELGCGIGAVLQRCRERGIGAEWYGVDYSTDGISYLSKAQPDIRTAVADISAGCPFPKTHFDLLLLSHVVEHLEDPAALLRSLSHWSFSYVLIEVPLENLPLLRLKARLFGRNNEAGHVQFFEPASFRKLLEGAGLEIVGELRYAPVLPVRVFRRMLETGRIGKVMYGFKLLTGHLLPLWLRRFWTNWYYAHHAALCIVKR